MLKQRTFVFLLAIFLFSPKNARAQVLISEVLPAPTQGKEWIELWNSGSETVTMTAWQLEDVLASPSVIAVITQQEITAGAYVVVELTTNKLNNTGDGVILKNTQGVVVDQMQYESSQENQSWNRPLNEMSAWHMSVPTPGVGAVIASPSPSPTLLASPSPLPSPTPSPAPESSPSSGSQFPFLQISEIMACPESGNNEWIEIVNQSNNAVSFHNWQVIDSKGNKRNINGDVVANGLTSFEWASGLLNNTGDTLTLTSDVNQEVFFVTIRSCESGQSQIFLNQEWVITNQPTKGAHNIANVVVSPSPQTSPTPSAGTVLGSSTSAVIIASPLAQNELPYALPTMNTQTFTRRVTLSPDSAPKRAEEAEKSRKIEWYLVGGSCILSGITILVWALRNQSKNIDWKEFVKMSH